CKAASSFKCIQGKWLGWKLANRQARTRNTDWHQHRIDARTIWQTPIYHRTGIINAPSDRINNTLDDRTHSSLAGETDWFQAQLSGNFHKNPVMTIDHDFRNVR